MSNINYEKQAQDYYGKAPIIILGSGASAAHGMSGMGALAQHLTEKTDVSELSDADMESWDNFCQTLRNGIDLETALHQVDVSKELTCKIINSTWSLINTEDCNIFKNGLQNISMFPLSRLLKHMFETSLKNKYCHDKLRSSG